MSELAFQYLTNGGWHAIEGASDHGPAIRELKREENLTVLDTLDKKLTVSMSPFNVLLLCVFDKTATWCKGPKSVHIVRQVF